MTRIRARTGRRALNEGSSELGGRVALWGILGLSALGFGVGCPAPDRSSKLEEPRGSPPYPLPELDPGGPTVAVVGPVKLGAKELEARLARQSLPVRRQLAQDPEQKRQFLENQVRTELLAQVGWNRGLYRDPRVQEAMKRTIVDLVMREELRQVGKGISVTDEEVRAAYRERESAYNQPAKIQLSGILRPAKTKAERKKERTYLQSVFKEIFKDRVSPKAFEQAARKHSQDELTRGSGGQLTFLSRGEIEERFGKETATELFDKTKVSQMIILDTKEGVVLFKKTAMRPPVQRTFDQVRGHLKGQLWGKKRSRAFDSRLAELKKRGNVAVDEKALEHIRIPVGAASQPKK